MGQRRACRTLGFDRTAIRYRSGRDDGELRARMRAPSGERWRFGYRRLHILLRREGVVVNRKRTQRAARRSRAGLRAHRPAAGPRSRRWDAGADPRGRSAERALVPSTSSTTSSLTGGGCASATKRCLAAVVGTSISGRRVVREVEALVARQARRISWSATTIPAMHEGSARRA